MAPKLDLLDSEQRRPWESGHGISAGERRVTWARDLSHNTEERRMKHHGRPGGVLEVGDQNETGLFTCPMSSGIFGQGL